MARDLKRDANPGGLMNIDAATASDLVRRRGLEVGYLAERYHRAFHEEAAHLAGLIALGSPSTCGAAFDALRSHLASHERLQEDRLFLAYESGAACEPALFAAWMKDTEALHRCSDAARRSCDVELTAPALCRRVAHFVSEIQAHLVGEVELLASWAGTEVDGAPPAFSIGAEVSWFRPYRARPAPPVRVFALARR